jgi:hypothetical protein
MWTLDKLVKPTHAANVFKKYYLLGGVDQGMFYVMQTPYGWSVSRKRRLESSNARAPHCAAPNE